MEIYSIYFLARIVRQYILSLVENVKKLKCLKVRTIIPQGLVIAFELPDTKNDSKFYIVNGKN
jgi:hypothetical protein